MHAQQALNERYSDSWWWANKLASEIARSHTFRLLFVESPVNILEQLNDRLHEALAAVILQMILACLPLYQMGGVHFEKLLEQMCVYRLLISARFSVVY
jgi:hypothetical protein